MATVTVKNVSEDLLKSINHNGAPLVATDLTTKDPGDIGSKFNLIGGAWVRVPLKLTGDKLEISGTAELATDAYNSDNKVWRGGASKTPKRRRRGGKSKSLRRKSNKA